MDTGTSQRTNIRIARGYFFMLAGIGLAIILIFFVNNLREKVVNDFTQHVSSIGTKFGIAEDAFEETRKLLLDRNSIPQEKIDQLRVIYQDLNSEFQELKDNIFIAKEEGNSIDESIILISVRINQVDLLKAGSLFVDNERLLISQLKAFDDCTGKVNYKESPEKVDLALKNCTDLLKSAKETANAMERTSNFVCEQENLPSIYVQHTENTYVTLARFYDSVAKKDYVAVDKNDKEFKSLREQLNTRKPVTYCVTKTLESIGKRLQ